MGASASSAALRARTGRRSSNIPSNRGPLLRTVVVTVRKDTKVERIKDGKRVAAKAGDIKEGQRIELYELEDGIQIGESMRIAGRSIVVEDKRK